MPVTVLLVPLLATLLVVQALCLLYFHVHADHLLVRQQLIAATRGRRRIHITTWDRLVIATLARFVDNWREHILIVKPATVVAWHREGFRIFWRWRSGRVGRPPVPNELRQLIRRMARENPLWGAPRVHGELLKLGYDVAQSTVSRHMPKRRGPPSTTWKTFVRHHLGEIVAMDFFTVNTAFFKPLHVLFLISLRRRKVIHFSVTDVPTAAFVANNLRQAFPEDVHPTWLLHDRDPVFASAAAHAIESIGMENLKSAPRSPWMNGYAERLIGSVRRECLDHVLILNERHLRRVLTEYFAYYHDARTHLGLRKDSPNRRAIHLPHLGDVITLPQVGALHHKYVRRAA